VQDRGAGGCCGEPLILGIWPGTRPPIEALHENSRSGRNCGLPDEAPSVRFRRYLEPERDGVDLRKEQVLIAVGRGFQKLENLALAESLPRARRCRMRFAVRNGSRWLPLSRRVGKSGLTVKPKFYFAWASAVTGAREGMRKSECIVAVTLTSRADLRCCALRCCRGRLEASSRPDRRHTGQRPQGVDA